MTKFSFPASRTLGAAAVKFIISFSVNGVSPYGAQAEPLYHCPHGQIYRVTKNICVPKQSKISSLNAFPAAVGKPAAEEASPDSQNHVNGPASASAPRTSSVHGSPAAVRKPAMKKASSAAQNHVGGPASTSVASDFISERIPPAGRKPAAQSFFRWAKSREGFGQPFHFAPQIASLHESPAAVGKPAVAEASSDAQKNHVGGPASASSAPQIASQPPRP